MQFLRDFLHNIVCENYTVDWKRNAFFLFVEYFSRANVTIDLKIKILTMIIIPSFAISFEKGEDNRLIRGLVQDEETNVISVFINKIINPFMLKESDDGFRIALLQFACLLVERASAHIHSNKKEDIRQLTTFGYSSLLHSKNYWDPTAIYNGHLLLSHIIARLANKKSWQEVVFKVFHSLLKAHAIEARHIVRQTLEVFMPMMPLKLNESNVSLINLTKSVIIKDGYAILQLYHVFQVIIRHHTIYYPVRHQLIQNMINSMQRLESSNSVDYRKLAIDIAEVIINWELRRIKETSESDEKVSESGSVKRSLQDVLQITVKKQAVGENSPQPGTSQQIDEWINKPIEWVHCKSVINFLFDLLFMLSEQVQHNQITPALTPNEVISKLSLNLLKKVLKKDVWIRKDEDLQFVRLSKVFEDPSKVSSVTICNFLEIFIHLLYELEESKILLLLRALQTGLATCVTSTTTKVLRLMSTFLSKVISLFPVETYMNYDELRFLYQTVEKTIRNGLEVFEKDSETTTASFFGTFLILKTAFANDSKYFEKFVEKFTKFVFLLKNEHVNHNTQQSTTPTSSTPNMELTKEMLLQSLQLLKNHIKVMRPETRKSFLSSILVELIEKSNDPRIIKTIIQVLDSWFKMKNPELEPTLREKIVLLQKLTHHIESRFSNELSLNVQFLEVIHFIYSDPDLNSIELTSKLDQAFLAGLRCSQPDIRKKFYEFFDESVEKNLYDRLLYILSTKAWDTIGHHYWIKQCIELLVLTANSKQPITSANASNLLPLITSGINYANQIEAKMFFDHAEVNSMTLLNFDEGTKTDDFTEALALIKDSNCEVAFADRDAALKTLVSSQIKFLQANREITTGKFLASAVQLCHMDSNLAEKVWTVTFPRLWTTMSDGQKINVTKEIIPFLSAGTKVNTKDSHCSAINTFTQTLTLCDPPVFIPPNLMKSLGKAHNIWHRMALVAEDMVDEFSKNLTPRESDDDSDEDEGEDAETLNEIVESLAKMYSSMHEEDLWAGLWQKYAKYPETNVAIFYEQIGQFEEAQNVYESVMFKCKQEIANGTDAAEISTEIQLWEDHWIRCTKELNDWNTLVGYAQTNKDKYSFLLMDCAWRISDWNLMRQALARAEQMGLKQSNYKLNLYNGYISVLNQKDSTNAVSKHIELASTACLQEWRRLPAVVSHMHIPILQVSQQIMELQEASQIHQDLQRKQALPFHDMKSIVKTWRNRLPVIADDLTHWNDIFTWRQHHYQLITESTSGSSSIVSNLGSQAAAQTMVKFVKIARKHNMLSVAQKSILEMDNIGSIPVSDCFQKVVQKVKCSLQLAQVADNQQNDLCEALNSIETANMDIFPAENTAVLGAYKGYLNTYLGRSAEASKAFTLAVDVCDSSNKAWALYGEYLDIIFTRNPKLLSKGTSAITCFLHASRDQSETKTRKYLAKVIWLLTYEETRPEMLKAFENYMLGVPTLNWLPWIPQLLNCLVQYESDTVMTLLNQIAKIFPQAIYFPIRTLYLMLKLEQRERHKCVEQAKALHVDPTDQPGTSMNQQTTAQAMKSTSAMWRCSKIMQLVREVHPTVVCSLEGILDQMVSKTEGEGVRWFRENTFEENLHQLKQGLAKFYAIAFDNRLIINDAVITQQTLNLVKKLMSNFSQVTESTTEAILQDPVFNKMRMQFANGFDFNHPENNKLLGLIHRFKACIKIMEEKVRQLPK